MFIKLTNTDKSKIIQTYNEVETNPPQRVQIRINNTLTVIFTKWVNPKNKIYIKTNVVINGQSVFSTLDTQGVGINNEGSLYILAPATAFTF